MDLELKIESLKQQDALLDWVAKGCPPIDLNILSLGIKSVVEKNAMRGHYIHRCKDIIKSSKPFFSENHKELADSFLLEMKNDMEKL